MSFTEISLIGCGRIGFILENDKLRNKPCTHYGGATSAGLHITSACDKNSGRLKQFSEVSHIPDHSLFTDYRDLLNNKKPAVTIIVNLKMSDK